MKNDKLVSIVVLTYNGEETINDALDSVLAQNYENLEIIVVDNASEDMTIDEVQNAKCKAQSHSAKLKIIKNEANIGFAGHNVGIENSNGEFVLCMNQDVILKQNFISEAVKLFQDEKVGAVQGLLKSKSKNKKSNIIDTTGIIAFRSRRFADRGQGENDKGQYNKIEEVFGVNGAAAFFRRKCLENVKISFRHLELVSGSQEMPKQVRHDNSVSEYWDEDFFMYKEDIDLSWRIRLYGWKIMYCPIAVAYVDRTSEPIREMSSVRKIISARKKQSQFVKYYSFKNHRLTIIKNELPSLFFGHLLWILPREIGAWLYVLFFEPKTWPAISELFKQMPRAWKKRKIIMKNKRVGAEEMRKWFA